MSKAPRHAVAILATVMVGVSAVAHADAVSDLRQTLARLYPATRIDSVQPSPVPGLFQLKIGTTVAYVESTGRYFFFGHLYDMPANKDLTADAEPTADQETVRTIDVGGLPKTDSFLWQVGTGGPEIALFSDPQCTFCRRLEATLATMPDVTVRLYPVAMLSGSSDPVAAVWCSADKPAAWKVATSLARNKPPSSTSKCDTSAIERNRELGQRLGIRGTPTIVGPDGRIIVGNLDAQTLRRWLSQTGATSLHVRMETR